MCLKIENLANLCTSSKTMEPRAQNYNTPLKLRKTLVKVADFSIHKDAFKTSILPIILCS